MNGKIVRSTMVATMVTAISMLGTGLAVAAPEAGPEQPGFTALSALMPIELSRIEPMSPGELDAVEGTFFDFGINLIFTPQFNICLFCSAVSQTNFVVAFGLNEFS